MADRDLIWKSEVPTGWQGAGQCRWDILSMGVGSELGDDLPGHYGPLCSPGPGLTYRLTSMTLAELRSSSVVGGRWNHLHPQGADQSLAQHGTQASLVGVPSGQFLHLWQMLSFELSDPSGATCLKTPCRRLCGRGCLPVKNQDHALYCNWVETGFASLAYLACMTPFHTIKNRDLVLFFFFL